MNSADQSDFTVCGTCHALRGPIGSVGAVQVRQLCDCAAQEERSAQPRLGDHNTAFELCRCCGTEALTSGSRWSVWFCHECKERVRALNQRSGRCVIPIGRHSLMNGVSFDPGANEASRAFADQLKRLFREMGGTEGWARAAVRLNLAAAGLPGDDIGLEAYLETLARLAPVKEQRFNQMVQSLSGRAGATGKER